MLRMRVVDYLLTIKFFYLCLMINCTSMDIVPEEAVVTEEDSGEVEESVYLSRLMLTGHQSSCPSVVSSAIPEDCSPQIDLVCFPGQSRNTSTTKQIYQTTGVVVSSDNPIRDETLSGDQSSSGSVYTLVAKPAPTQEAISSNPPKHQSECDWRSSTRRNSHTSEKKRQPLTLITSAPKQINQQRTTSKKRRRPDTTLEKGTMVKESNIRRGVVRRKTGKVLLRSVINRRNKYGETKLHLAVMEEDIQDVKDMISAGSSVNAADYAGWTPLHEAVERNNFQITEVLLHAGAHINCRGDDGITPLHEAMKYHYYKIGELLLKSGADPLSKCDKGKTPLDMTSDRSMQLMVEKYLQKSGEKSFINTDSSVNSVTTQINNKRSLILQDTISLLQESSKTAHTSDQGSCIQSSQEELFSGPSNNQPNLQPSPLKTERHLLCLMKNQCEDFHRIHSLSPEELESEASDTSSCSGSDVTVDYLEDNSPQYWTKCATQDFSEEPDANLKPEETGSHIHCNIHSIAEKEQPSLCVNGDSIPTCSTTPSSTGLQELEGSQDCYDTYVTGQMDSTLPNQRVKRRKADKEVEKDFLEYLLNFRISSIVPESKTNGSTLLKKEDECKYQHAVDIYESTTESASENSQEGSISLLSPHLNEQSDSQTECVHSSRPMTEASPKDKVIDVDSPGSLPLLTKMIHSTEILPNHDYLQSKEPALNIVRPNKELEDPVRLKKQLLSSPSSEIESLQRISGLEACVNTKCNDLTQITSQKLESFETPFQNKPLNCDQVTDTVLIPNQPLMEEKTSALYNTGQVEILKPKGFICYPDMESHSSCHGSIEEPMNNGTCAVASTSFETIDQLKVVVQDWNENSADSDCTLVEVPYAPEFNASVKSAQREVSGFGERHGERESDNRVGLPVGNVSELDFPTSYFPRFASLVDTEKNGRVKEPSRNPKRKKKTREQKKSPRPQVKDALKTADSKKEPKISKKCVHKKNGRGETFLHQACIRGDLKLVRRLIDAGSIVNAADNAGWTPLHEASVHGFDDVVKELLEAGADVNSRGIDGRNPLHDAVQANRIEIVKLLLLFGSSPHDKNLAGESAVDLAEEESIKELLLKYKGPFYKPGQTSDTTQQESLSLGANLEPEPVFEEIPYNSVVLALDSNTPKTLAGWTTPLHEACFKGFVGNAELLLESGANVTIGEINGRNPLHDPVQTDLKEFGSSLHDKNMAGENAVNLEEQESIKKQPLKYTDPFSTPDEASDTSQQEYLPLAEGNLQTEPIFEDQSNSPEGSVVLLMDSNQAKQSADEHALSLDEHTDHSTNEKSDCHITDGIIRHGDDELKIILKGQSHKAFLMENGCIRDTRGRVYPLLEQWAESVQEGQQIAPRTSDLRWKKVMCQSKALWNSSSGCLNKEGALEFKSCTITSSSSKPVVKEVHASDILMNIKSIRLVSDEEFSPSHWMNQYWNFLTQSEVWDFDT